MITLFNSNYEIKSRSNMSTQNVSMILYTR